MKFKRLCEYLLHLLWPVSCPVCGRPGVKICDECLSSIFPEHVSTFKLEGLSVKSYSVYDDEIHEILSSLSEDSLRRVYRASGFKLSEVFSCPENLDLILPVPPYSTDSKTFSKSKEIAQALGQAWGVKVEASSRFMRGEFVVPEGVKGLRVALVNDINITCYIILRFAEACTEAGAEVLCAYVCSSLEPVNEPEEHFPTSYFLPPYFAKNAITRKFGNLTVKSAALYHTEARDVIHSFKFDGRRELCRPLGRHMAELFVETEADYLVPVPLHINSERKYNQTYEIAKGMCEIWEDSEILKAAEWSREIPKRTNLTAQERMQISAEDFRITRDIAGLKVALLDDVCTTGSTLQALASACERAGAIVICAYTLASTN